jgi:transcriptional regulator GlxA family with amidase domain
LAELSTTNPGRGDPSEALCFNLIENVLLRLHMCEQQGATIRRGQPYGDPIRDAAEFVISHYDEPVLLAELADRVHVSRSRLSSAFKARHGMGPIQWRDMIRLGRAQELLVTSDLTIREISARVSWADALYFSRRFKSQYGEAPRAYRLRVRSANSADAAVVGLSNGDESARGGVTYT